MILLINPRATRPANRRFPLSVMALGAALPDGVTWRIVDGNRPLDAFDATVRAIEAQAGTRDPVRLVAMSVMPGPQLVHAVPLAKRLKARYPAIPIVWGGYFPSLYPKPVLNAPYVDWVVRGQGEETLAELLDVLEGRRDPRTVAGIAFRDGGDGAWLSPERRWRAPDHLPPPPYHAIDVDEYLRPTFLGRRSGVYQASIGCPYACNFCGVISVFGSREQFESPARTVAHLAYLVRRHGMDGLHFYDSNFFVREDHAVELCERMTPLRLAWWCEARVDAMLRFRDSTWRTLKRAGLKMVFFGAESGSNEVLRKMAKRLTMEETLEVAARTREHGIIPEFSFVLGDPDEPEREIENTLAFVRKLKRVNPAMELITYYYTPTPQRRGTYGNVDPLSGTPETLEDWTRPEWVAWMTHEDPNLAWLDPRLKARVADFELVLKSRFPSLHDTRTRPWGRALAKVIAAPRWRAGRYRNPRLLRAVRRWASVPDDDAKAYGHLRPPIPAGA